MPKSSLKTNETGDKNSKTEELPTKTIETGDNTSGTKELATTTSETGDKAAAEPSHKPNSPCDRIPNADETSTTKELDADLANRLSSFKIPRDLSLGGVKPNKKVFTPNLKATRNKSKGPTRTVPENKSDDRNNQERIHQPNVHTTRKNPKIIKSDGGIFSAGMGGQKTPRKSYPKDSDSTLEPSKSTSRGKTGNKSTKKQETGEPQEERSKKFRPLFEEDAFTAENAVDDFRRGLDITAPIKLPMDYRDRSGNEKPVAAKVKTEPEIKLEPGDDECAIDLKPWFKPNKDLSTDETDIIALLKSDKPVPILIQMPQLLPCQIDNDEDDGPRVKPSTSAKHKGKTSDKASGKTSGKGTGKHTAKQSPNANKKGKANEKPPTVNLTFDDLKEPEPEKRGLREMTEGRVGSLQIHRSGRVTLKLGNAVFLVAAGTKPVFHQEMMVVTTDETKQTANVGSIGLLDHKLVVTPDWHTLIKSYYR